MQQTREVWCAPFAAGRIATPMCHRDKPASTQFGIVEAIARSYVDDAVALPTGQVSMAHLSIDPAPHRPASTHQPAPANSLYHTPSRADGRSSSQRECTQTGAKKAPVAAARAATVRTEAVVSTPATFTTAKSDAIFAEAQLLMPGGVSSPVRAFKSVGGGPVVFDRVKGAYAWDVDGNKYVDYIGTWGPAICGACNDEVCTGTELPPAPPSPSHPVCTMHSACHLYISARQLSSALTPPARAAVQVNEALVKALEKGTSFGAPCELEVSTSPRHQA